MRHILVKFTSTIKHFIKSNKIPITTFQHIGITTTVDEFEIGIV